MKSIFLPEAEKEMLEAASYYQSKAPHLGIDYLSEIDRAIEAIEVSPYTWPILLNHFLESNIYITSCEDMW